MLSLYVFATIVGLGLLAMGVLGGGEVDEMELPDIEGDLGGADTSWKKAFSIRALSYFLAGFGTTGALLTLLGTAATLTLLLALGMGGFAGAAVLIAFGWLRNTEGGFAGAADAYVGAVGRVRVPIRATVPGSVDIQHDGRILTLRALPLGGGDIDPSAWDEVLVVDVDPERGILLVQPLDTFLADGGDASPPSSHP